MRHTEQDRIEYNKHIAAQDMAARTAKWLQDNPEVGVLNSGLFYIIRKNEMVLVALFAELPK